jgi:bromodomain and WD repeat domain-containing protein 1/3
LRPPPSSNRKEKKRGRKKLTVKYEDETEVDVEADEPFLKTTRKGRKARVIYDEDEDDDIDNENCVEPKDIKPSTSAGVVSPKKQQKPGRKPKTPDNKVKKRMQIENTISKHGKMNECPPEYRMPEWLTITKPKKSPFLPQIGDEVVYFRQGHEIYVETVKQMNTYDIEESTLPWNKYSQLEVAH